MPRSKIDPQVRAKALADLADGDQPAIVAERYKLDPQLTRAWKKRYVTARVTPVTSGVTTVHRPAVEAQQLALGDLIMANLRAKLVATQRIAEHATLETWLSQQSATGVAELFESLDRSAVAILDRLAGATSRRADDDSADGADIQ